MLSFDISSVHAEAVQVNADLSADDSVWQEEDLKPAGPVHVTGRLSATGSGQFYFHGVLKGAAEGECRRCLNDVREGIEAEVQFIFAEPDTETSEDPDVFPVDVRVNRIDLRQAIREEWMLVAPAFPVCREDCKGLCPMCGVDLNAASCGCTRTTTDKRWDALHSLQSRQAGSKRD